MPAPAAVSRALPARRRVRALCLALCPLLGLAAATGCDDGLSESVRGALLVSQTEGATSITERAEVSFESVRPNTTSSSLVFLLRNSRSEGDLRIESVEFFTESPYITATLDNDDPACSGGTCEFDGFTLAPLASSQLDLIYKPLADDIGCGDPPADLDDAPDDYCGHVVIRSDDPSNSEVVLVLSVPRLSGDLQVCLVESGECAEQLTIDFNAAAVGDPPQTKRFTVNNVGASNLTVTNITETFTPAEDFSLTSPSGAAPPILIEPSDAPVEFELTFEPTTNAETRSGSLQIRAENGDTSIITVRVGNPNAAQIEVDTRELRYVNVQSPQSETKQLSISNTGGPTAAPLTVNFVLDPSTNPDYVVFDAAGNPRAGGQCRQGSPPTSCTSPLVIPRQNSELISVTYAPTTDQPSDATLRISSNDPDAADKSIAIALVGGGGTGFVVSDTTTLTWTAPAAGSTDSMTLVLTNEGNAPVELGSFELRSAVPADSATLFTVTPAQALPVTLAPSDTLSVDVTFARPVDEPIDQARQADLVFLHDAGSGETIVSLRVEFP